MIGAALILAGAILLCWLMSDAHKTDVANLKAQHASDLAAADTIAEQVIADWRRNYLEAVAELAEAQTLLNQTRRLLTAEQTYTGLCERQLRAVVDAAVVPDNVIELPRRGA